MCVSIYIHIKSSCPSRHLHSCFPPVSTAFSFRSHRFISRRPLYVAVGSSWFRSGHLDTSPERQTLYRLSTFIHTYSYIYTLLCCSWQYIFFLLSSFLSKSSIRYWAGYVPFGFFFFFSHSSLFFWQPFSIWLWRFKLEDEPSCLEAGKRMFAFCSWTRGRERERENITNEDIPRYDEWMPKIRSARSDVSQHLHKLLAEGIRGSRLAEGGE